jgi:hypothetical protein
MGSACLKKAADHPNAGHSAAIANDIGANHRDAGKGFQASIRLLLTVEYTRSAQTAWLYFEEFGTFDTLRIEHHNELGAAALDECQASNGTANCLSPLKHAFRRLVKMPVNKIQWPSDNEVPNRVSDVVLLGDKAYDPRLKHALCDVLGEQVILLPKVVAQSQGEGVVDPHYASARGDAIASWARQNDKFREEL